MYMYMDVVRPAVEKGNYNAVFEAVGHPKSAAFDDSLSELLKKCHELENFYKNHRGKK